MKIQLIVVGKTDHKYLLEGIDNYVGRLKHYNPFEMVVLTDIKNTKSLSQQQQKEREGEMILSATVGSEVFLLDEGGKTFSSEDFALFLQKQILHSSKQIAFVVGGAYGFSDAVYAYAKGKISLSAMTFSHQMVRLFFVEQLYRAFTILRGEPYHHK
ncbi:MAG: 23S rRNA (pseudouridine(1915)-N(3))-methyltransferase RlmH [Bacteroidales bacterium]